MKRKLLLLCLSLFAVSVKNKVQAQTKTVFDQLNYVNAEWQNQPDAPALLKKEPAKYLNEQQLVQLYLAQTEMLLRKRSMAGLSAKLKQSRLRNLDILHAYLTAGQFPKNTMHSNRQPYFIDTAGTYCAAGYLMKMTGADNMARRISNTQNYSYLIDIHNPDLMDWVAQSGLTLSELALIQPGYGGEWPSCITEMHFNNTGADVNEYIEVHQSTGALGGMFPYTNVLFLDNAGILYKSLAIGQMQVSPNPEYRYYSFPANESFADAGKVVLMFNTDTVSVYTFSSSGISIHDFRPSSVTRNYTPSEDDNTPVGQSLNFCGLYASTWFASIQPGTPGTINSCIIGAAPVSFGSFDYSTAGNAVKLKWQTGSQSNTDYFDVQRSSDGINFTTIGKVKAAGTSSSLKDYAFIDPKPLYINHYRLSLADLDGRATLSKILFVKCAKAMPFELFQNQVSNVLKINVSNGSSAPGSFTIYELSGRLVKTTQAKIGIQEINVSSLSAGNYIINFTLSSGEAYTQRFQKI